MTQDDSAEFIPRLVALAQLYNAPMSEMTQQLYFGGLEDLELSAVIRAMNEAVKACEFMPRPAKLRELAVGNTEDRAEIAWMEFKRVARLVGGYGSPTLDPILADTILAVFGTWENACWLELSPEMWAAKRKEFGRTYHAIVTRRQNATEPQQLTGFVERENKKIASNLADAVKRLEE